MEHFTKLNSINVNEKAEEKNGLTYLSWAWAWSETKKVYPDAVYKIEKFENNLPYVYDAKTGYMVFTSVTIEDITHEMWLPVMDSANKAMMDYDYSYDSKKKFWNSATKQYDYKIEKKTVQAATMFDINKTIMRCLTKNLAMFGLGLYIYAGEDLPEVIEETITEHVKEPVKEIKATPKQVELLKSKYLGDNLTKLLEFNSINKLEDLSLAKASELISKLQKEGK